MTYSLGFDGGGTKTECVVLNADGVAVGEGGGGPANPLRSGYETAFASLREAGCSRPCRSECPPRRYCQRLRRLSRSGPTQRRASSDGVSVTRISGRCNAS